MIIAANVLHATTLLKSTMENVRRLLKAGGRLILIEESVRALAGSLSLHCQDGGLVSPQSRRQCIFPTSCRPRTGPPGWATALKTTVGCGIGDAGFSGLDLCLQDYPGDPAHTSRADPFSV